MKKMCIGVDLSVQLDSAVVFISFRNDKNYNASDVNVPMMYQDKPVGIITKVNEEYVSGYIYDMKFLKEFFMNGGRSSVSFGISK